MIRVWCCVALAWLYRAKKRQTRARLWPVRVHRDASGSSSLSLSWYRSTIMVDSPRPPPTTQRKSRVLAALDNPDFIYNITPPPQSAGGPSGSTLPPASSGPYRSLRKQRLVTPSPAFDYESSYADLLGPSSSRQRKRKTPDHGFDSDDGEWEASGSSPAPPGGSQLGASKGFNLRYDQEGPVRAIDRGGPDQEMKCVVLFSWL